MTLLYAMIAWAILGAIVTPGIYARHERSVVLGFVLGVVAGAAGGILLLGPLWWLVSRSKKRCPHCAENIRREAMVCKHCGFRYDEATWQRDMVRLERARQRSWQVMAGIVILLVSSACLVGGSLLAVSMINDHNEKQEKQRAIDAAQARAARDAEEALGGVASGYRAVEGHVITADNMANVRLVATWEPESRSHRAWGLSPDGNLIAFATDRDWFQIYDITRGQVTSTLAVDVPYRFPGTQPFSQDSRFFTIWWCERQNGEGGCAQAVLRVYDVRTGNYYDLPGQTDNLVDKYAVAPGGKMIVSYVPGQQVILRVRQVDRPSHEWLLASTGEDRAPADKVLVYGLDGRKVYASNGSSIFVWDTASGDLEVAFTDAGELRALDAMGHWAAVMQFNPDRIHIVDSASWGIVMTLNIPEGAYVPIIVFHPDSTMLATQLCERGSESPTLCQLALWDIVTGQYVIVPGSGWDHVYNLAFNAAGTAVIAYQDDEIRVWGIK